MCRPRAIDLKRSDRPRRWMAPASVLLCCLCAAACTTSKRSDSEQTTASAGSAAVANLPTPQSTTTSATDSQTSAGQAPQSPTVAFVSTAPSAATAPAAVPAAVVVTYSAWNPTTHAAEASGFIANLISNDGTCTLTLTLAGDVQRVSRAATADATTTQCGTLAIPGSQLHAGTWSGVITYSSPTNSGSSSPISIEVTP